MTQHNAALVEETNAAIEQTEAQAVELDKIVEVFKIETTAEGPIASAPQASKPVTQMSGVQALQERVTLATKSYLTFGNAALK